MLLALPVGYEPIAAPVCVVRDRLLLPGDRGMARIDGLDDAAVTTALRGALWRRDRAEDPAQAGLIHHLDAGSQFTSVAFAGTLVLEGIAASVGSIGDAYDNTLAESTIGLSKNEAIRSDYAFRNGPCAPSKTSSGSPRNGLTGTTAGACTPVSATCHPTSTKPPTTLTTSRHHNSCWHPHRSGKEQGKVQAARSRRRRRTAATDKHPCSTKLPTAASTPGWKPPTGVAVPTVTSRN